MKQKLLAMIFIAIISMLAFLSYKNYCNLKKQTTTENNMSNYQKDHSSENKGKRSDKIPLTQRMSKSKEKFSDQQILEVQHFISEMKDEYTKLNYDTDFKNKILDLYHKNKDITLILRKTIIDHDFAIRIANEEQNYARIFAIQGLKEIAMTGDTKPLISTIQDFSKLLQIKESSSKGELADLDDLLRSYISIHDMDKFTESLEDHLITAGFNQSIKNKDVYDIYDQAFYFTLSHKIGREKAKELLNKYFRS